MRGPCQQTCAACPVWPSMGKSYVMSCHVMSCHVMLRYVTLRYVTLTKYDGSSTQQSKWTQSPHDKSKLKQQMKNRNFSRLWPAQGVTSCSASHISPLYSKTGLYLPACLPNDCAAFMIGRAQAEEELPKKKNYL